MKKEIEDNKSDGKEAHAHMTINRKTIEFLFQNFSDTWYERVLWNTFKLTKVWWTSTFLISCMF